MFEYIGRFVVYQVGVLVAFLPAAIALLVAGDETHKKATT